jgi:CDP-diglyceride synthetase
MSVDKSPTNHQGRIRSALVMMAIFLAAGIGDYFWRVPLLPVIATITAGFCWLELWSLRDRTGRLLNQPAAIYLQFLVTIAAIAMIWIVEQQSSDWVLTILAFAAPVLAQNMCAFYLGRFVMPEARKHHVRRLVRILNWRHFRHSPRKTLGGLIVSTLFALVITLPWVLTSPLLTWIVILSSLGAGIGDLAESRLKRLTGVNDSGERLRRGQSPIALTERFIAPHGGFLDRFDSLFFCAALALIPILIFIN